jgi:hypothetical protein
MMGYLLLAMTAQKTPALEALYTASQRYERGAFVFAPPSEQRRRDLESMVTALVDPRAEVTRLRARARSCGLELVAAHDEAGALWVLHEPEGHRQGAGFFAVRPGGKALCVQAPHTFFDKGTGPLALAVFRRLQAACLAVSTVDRHAPATTGAVGAADLAHAEGTLFHAFTRAVLAGPRWPLVQLHGFGDNHELPEGTAGVVSDGGSKPAAEAPAARLREGLRRRMGAPVLLYGVDARVLGATTNVQALEARRTGVAFVHVDMSLEARAVLRAAGGEPLAAALREAFAWP